MTAGANERIEQLYRGYGAGGQAATLARHVSTEAVVDGFRTTVAELADVRAAGSFHPERKPLIDLAEERARVHGVVADGYHLQALLWAPPRWPVANRPELEFMFVDREICPGSAEARGRRVWAIGERWRVSADLLLMNTADRTPIVAEVKVGGDENADYALVQALAAAAQLTPRPQRERLRSQYSDYFGTKAPARLDVYVILAHPPTRGTRPKLLDRAVARAAELKAHGHLDEWIRRIEILEVEAASKRLTFKAVTRLAG